MGIGGIGIWQLAIILVIVLLLFGTKRLKGLGGDLGGAIKGFKKAMNDEEQNKQDDLKKVNAENTESVDGNTASADTVKAESKKD